MKRMLLVLLVGCIAWGASRQASAQVTVGVDPSAPWVGYMNVFELPDHPTDPNAFLFGAPWGTADLVATFNGSTLSLKPATIETSDGYWYQGGVGGPGVPGNKTMDANMYQEVTGLYAGIDLTFSGEVLSNTLVSPYTAVAFIKDFAMDYSSSVMTTVPLTGGSFSVSATTINDPARHVQFGFEVFGPNVWPTDGDAFGSIEIGVVPEPASLALGTGLVVMLAVRRRRV